MWKSDMQAGSELMLDLLGHYWYLYVALVLAFLWLAYATLRISYRYSKSRDNFMTIPLLLQALGAVCFSVVMANEFTNWWLERSYKCEDYLLPTRSCSYSYYTPEAWQVAAGGASFLVLFLICVFFTVHLSPLVARQMSRKHIRFSQTEHIGA